MLALLTAVVLGQGSFVHAYNPHGPVIQVVMENRGTFEITTDPKSSPKTVAGILSLVKSKFYDRQRVHRVESWVTQWGAPASKTKALDSDEVLGGGSGKPFPFEMCEVDFVRGVCGIASEGLQMGGDSQIFILKADALRLYHSYAVLGKVTKGMDVVDKIKKGDRIKMMRVKP